MKKFPHENKKSLTLPHLDMKKIPSPIAVSRHRLRASRGAHEGPAGAARHHEDLSELPSRGSGSGNQAASYRGCTGEGGTEPTEGETGEEQEVPGRGERGAEGK